LLYLCSKSPRRRQLLEQIGLRFGTVDVDVPEVRASNEPPEDYVSRVAREKAGAGLLKLSGVVGAVVLGADTEVVLDNEVFGKAVDEAHAADMLRRLSGRTHRVLSAVWCVNAGGEDHVLSITEVKFSALSESQIRSYVGTDEWVGKAGAYGIQGRAEAFVAHLNGSYSGVMGLPLFETTQLLEKFGIRA
jgi:nucleoside triphosphate pyrophosphatase